MQIDPQTMKTLLCFLALSAAPLSVNAAPPYVRVLLPLYLSQPTPGAYGSVWQSQFTIHNTSPSRQYTIATVCLNLDGCAGDVTTDEDINPNQTKTGLPPRYPVPTNPVGGVLLWLVVTGAPYDNGDDLAFQLRVADISRSETTAGTEVPVVRENEFRTSTIHLLNVPTDPRFRLALRLFEMNFASANFEVRIFDQATNALISTRQLTTTTPIPPAFRATPGFAEIDDLLAGASTQPDQLRIEIEPLTTGAASWAYVSITNNESQQITLVTPQ